jgi:hypothetical protein
MKVETRILLGMCGCLACLIASVWLFNSAMSISLNSVGNGAGQILMDALRRSVGSENATGAASWIAIISLMLSLASLVVFFGLAFFSWHSRSTNESSHSG